VLALWLRLEVVAAVTAHAVSLPQRYEGALWLCNYPPGSCLPYARAPGKTVMLDAMERIALSSCRVHAVAIAANFTFGSRAANAMKTANPFGAQGEMIVTSAERTIRHRRPQSHWQQATVP
jgi:hypothetical protein